MTLTLATKFMDKFGLPEEHNMLLVLRCFFLNREEQRLKSATMIKPLIRVVASELSFNNKITRQYAYRWSLEVSSSSRRLRKSVATLMKIFKQISSLSHSVRLSAYLSDSDFCSSYKNSCKTTVDLKANHLSNRTPSGRQPALKKKVLSARSNSLTILAA